MTYFISVANQKGGVAKTTTVVSLGASLAHKGQKVLLVDLDAQANLTMSLGIDPIKTHKSITNVLLSTDLLTSVRRQSNLPGLDIIPSNAEMGMSERFLPIRKDYENILRSAFTHITNNGTTPYDYVLFDCPPSLGAVTTNALHASHMLIIPTQAEYFSLSALRNMLGFVRRIREQGHPNLIYRILLTMYDVRNRVHRNLRAQLETTFNEGLFQSVIAVDTKLRESSLAGQPIIQYQPNSRGALQYQSLADEVNQHVHEYIPEFV
jgi:chromosome partitioning protein